MSNDRNSCRKPMLSLAAIVSLFMTLLLLHAIGNTDVKAFAQNADPGQQTPGALTEAAGIEATALVLPISKFCEYGPQAYMAYVPVEITVANGRHEPIILAQTLHVQRIMVGKTPDETLAQKYELATAPRPLHLSASISSFGSRPSEESFAILRHNETYEFTAVQGIPVRNQATDNVPGTVYPGKLAISFEIQAWPYLASPANLQKQWSRFGDLVTAPVITYPAPIELPANPPTEKCGLLFSK